MVIIMIKFYLGQRLEVGTEYESTNWNDPVTTFLTLGHQYWGDLGVDGWILGWISRRWDVGIWTGLGWPRIKTGGGHS